MKTHGNAVAGTFYTDQAPDLPRADLGRVVHRPWCTDCKRKHDADQLDDDGRCARCARAALSRAAAAERRAVREAAERAAAAQRPAQAPSEPRARRTARRPSTRVPGTRSTTTRTVDHAARIERLETKRTVLPRQLEDVDQQLERLNAEHGTTTTVERRERRDKLDLPAAEIIAAYRAGATMGRLATEHGCTPPTIRRLLLEHGEPTRDKRINYTHVLIKSIRDRYVDQGMSTLEIARELKVSPKVVAEALRRADVTLRPAAPRKPRDGARKLKDRIAALGVTARQIKEWGLEHGHVTYIARGIPSAALVDAYTSAHDTNGA